MIYFLDTNIWIFILNEKYPHLNKRIENCDKNTLKMPSIVLSELYYKAEKSRKPERVQENIRRLLTHFEVIPFDNKCAIAAGRIKAELIIAGQKTSDSILLIAATTLANNGVIVTNNTREFLRIDGLAVEDWTIP